MLRDEYVVAALFFFILALILIFLRKKPPLPYKRVRYILTPAERKFFHALQEAVGERYYIFTKVRAADVLLPKDAKDRSRWRSAFNKVACKHFDYVLCDGEFRILLAIELDDRSHDRADRRERDDFVNWACKSAGFELMRIKLQKSYNPKELRALIKRRIGK
ncbi:MAG: DUF2726 domain-containing protein [Epsilonproteobacteria bacterium]|nr:DUF2726 domain-containing protein [Campylobacterota bacterium]